MCEAQGNFIRGEDLSVLYCSQSDVDSAWPCHGHNGFGNKGHVLAAVSLVLSFALLEKVINLKDK